VLHDWSTHGLIINKYIHLNPVRVRKLGGHEGRGDLEQEPDSDLRVARVDALQRTIDRAQIQMTISSAPSGLVAFIVTPPRLKPGLSSQDPSDRNRL
jgi:hypothetical protein